MSCSTVSTTKNEVLFQPAPGKLHVGVYVDLKLALKAAWGSTGLGSLNNMSIVENDRHTSADVWGMKVKVIGSCLADVWESMYLLISCITYIITILPSLPTSPPYRPISFLLHHILPPSLLPVLPPSLLRPPSSPPLCIIPHHLVCRGRGHVP